MTDKKLSLIIKIFLTKWLLIPAFILILSFSLLWTYIETQNIKKHHRYYAENLGSHIEVYLNDCSEKLKHSFAHISIKQSGYSLLNDFIGKDLSFLAVYLLNSEGLVLRSVPGGGETANFSGLIENEIGNNDFTLTSPYYSVQNDRVVIGMIEKGKNQNLIYAELNLGSLEKHIKNVSEFINKGSVFLTDSFGNVIAHSDMSLVKQQVNKGDLKIFSKIRKQNSASGFFKTSDGIKLISARNISKGKLNIVLEQDALSLCMPVVITAVFLLAGALALFGSLIFLFDRKLYRSVINPIALFTKNIESAGNKTGFNSEIHHLKVSDEFKELTDLKSKFAQMAETIKQREKSLRQSDQILENSDHIAVFKDTDLRYVKANKAFTNLTGLKDVYGKTDYDLFKNISSTEEIDKYIENDKKALLLNKGEVLTREENVSDAGKEQRTFLTKKFPVYNENNEILGIGTLSSEITELKKSEEKLEAEKERLAVTLRSIGDGVITTDINSRVLLVNKVAEKLTGWTQQEAYQKTLPEIFNIVNETTGKKHENPVEKVIKTGETAELANHTKLISRHGSEKIIEDSAAPIKDKNSKTIGAVLVFRDMTEKNRLRETIQKTAKLESLGVLAGGIAHDFNNLLGGIYGYIDLSREFATQDKVREFLGKSLETIERARNLTGQLLTFSKGGAPVKKVQPPGDYIKKTADFALSGSNTQCIFNIEKDLPMCDFDKNQIGQVIENIVINAQQAMPGGGTIKISAANTYVKENEHPRLKPGSYVKISVKDSGTGIPPEIQNKIFDPFFTTKPTGHGIGLATCYSITEKHGGTIDVESTPHKGSVFHIYLPAVSKNFSKDNHTIPEKHKGKGTILVMDDEKVVRKMTASMLESFGYNTVGVENGTLAVDYFKKPDSEIKAMIFDLTIPGGVGGVEAVKKIREINLQIPVFVASGYSKDPVMNDPEKYGFTASIIKPFKISELAEIFNKYLL
ncbi:MAG: hybrid sensor histidine kinase/response regulator [Thermodesulfobacteriota bacterium]